VGHVRYRPINLHYSAYIITGGEGTYCRPSDGSRVFAYPCCVQLSEKGGLESYNYMPQLTWLCGISMTTGM